MNPHLAHHIRPARRLGTLSAVAVAVAALAAPTSPALARRADPRVKRTMTFHFYSQITSLLLTRADGTVFERMAQVPKAGDVLEITENAYSGTHKSHSKKIVATSHTICVFKSAKSLPSCDGQAAVGGNQMLLFRTPASRETLITGGTGRFAGATGTVTSTQVSETDNSDVVIAVGLPK